MRDRDKKKGRLTKRGVIRKQVNQERRKRRKEGKGEERGGHMMY